MVVPVEVNFNETTFAGEPVVEVNFTNIIALSFVPGVTVIVTGCVITSFVICICDATVLEPEGLPLGVATVVVNIVVPLGLL